MKKFSFILLIILSSIGTRSLLSQSLNEWTSAADHAFQQQDYYSAYRYYDVAINYDTSRIDLWYKLGESAQFFTAYNTADRAYQKVNASSLRDSFPLLDFRRAEVLQKKGYYTAAASLFETYISRSDTLLEEAENNFINCEWAADELSRPANTIINHMGDQINSPQNDFGLFRKKDTIYFSSLRFINKKDVVVPRREIAKILRQDEPDGEIIELPSSINQAGRMAAHTAYNTRGDVVYYTLCDYIGKTAAVRCDIYRSKIGKNGQWGEPSLLTINDQNATNTEPNVGLNPLTGKECLYFVSDRSGGKGGLDIYRTELMVNDTYGPVEILDAINTAGDDVTPFYYAPTKTLYFSTDGLLTMGGLDVYRSSWIGGDWDRPVTMGVPLNSSYNDLYYVRFEDEEHAYFASNRPDSLAIFWDETKDACCNDLYKIGITDEIKLLALTFNELDLTALPLASVALYDVTSGQPRLIDSIHNPSANDFNFIVMPGRKYELVATRLNYSKATEQIDLTKPDLIPDGRIEKRLYLAPGIKLDVFTFDEMDSTALLGTTAFLYELTDDGELVLIDSIVNPTANDYHFTLDFDKQYQVSTQKDGYTLAKAVIDTRDPKIAAQSRIKRDLYMKPGLFLEVYSWRLLDKKPLTAATIYLYEYTDQRGEVLVDSIVNHYGHQSWFKVEKGKRYVIRGERSGFGPAESSLDLSGDDVPVSGTYRKNLYFGQLLEIFTFDAKTEQELPGAKVRLIDATTDELIVERINPIDNDFRFSVALDRPYKLEISRKGYTSIADVITFTEEDLAQGKGKIVLDIFLEPMDTPDSMLPLFLYYDNDQPNPGSISSTTDLEYIETNVEYYEKKQEFIQSFTEGMVLEEAFKLRRSFNDFFNREVRGGRYDLEEFAKRLLAYLDSGNTFTIDLKGFASPRSSAAYNKILSKRRIVAVRNFLERYEGGKLLPYIKDKSLQFTTSPLGETQADPRVIAQMDDRRNSIYNVFASLERRVELHSSDENK